MIKQIEELEPELKVHTLIDTMVLENGHVEVDHSRLVNAVKRRLAEKTRVRASPVRPEGTTD